ncbi:MAG: hypothetical protein JWM58_2236 [Rhizobium sp.]|nr:hypothetical protein [Rhizobium sp.]
MSDFVKITLIDGTVIVAKESVSAAAIAKRLEKDGFFETTHVDSSEDEGTKVVIMRAGVSMVSAYSLPPTTTGAVRITSVPSKTRN